LRIEQSSAKSNRGRSSHLYLQLGQRKCPRETPRGGLGLGQERGGERGGMTGGEGTAVKGRLNLPLTAWPLLTRKGIQTRWAKEGKMHTRITRVRSEDLTRKSREKEDLRIAEEAQPPAARIHPSQTLIGKLGKNRRRKGLGGKSLV